MRLEKSLKFSLKYLIMKRGRPIVRSEIQPLISQVLEESRTPLNINAIAKKIKERTGRRYSWNTIQKYLNELVEIGQIEAIKLPHSKKKGVV